MDLPRRPFLSILAALAVLAPRPVAAADLAEIKARGVLKVLAVIQRPTPQFFTLEPNLEPGFDREILEGFARAQGVGIEYVTLTSFDQLVPALLEGRGDLIAGRVSNTPVRAEHVDFTAEVFPTRDLIFNHAPAPAVLTREQLLALPRIATLRGSSMAEALRAAGVPEAKIVYPDPPESLPARVESGEYPAGAWVLEAAMVWQLTHPTLQMGMSLGAPQSLAYGVPKGTPNLLAALNGHIRIVRQSGTWNRLVVKYFGERAPEILKAAR
jgi:membrane-bound lytic murein transglycosylase F